MEQPRTSRKDQLRLSYADLQLKQARNQIYTVILMLFGTLMLILGITTVVADEMSMQGTSAAIFMMGFVLFGSGYLWKTHDQQRIEKAKAELEGWEDSDEEIEGLKRV